MPKNNRAKTLNKAKKNYNGLKYPKKNKSCKNKLKTKKKFKRSEPTNNDKNFSSLVKSFENIEIKEKIHPLKIDVTSKELNLKIEPKISEGVINNLKPDPIVINKFINKEEIIINTKNLLYNSGGGDCWFKTISLALYNNEEYHLTIRKKIYESLLSKKSYFKEKGLTVKFLVSCLLAPELKYRYVNIETSPPEKSKD